MANAAPDETLVYVETHYFGGVGYQAAAIIQHGQVVWSRSQQDGEITADSPINAALRELGIVATGQSDEFETVGLNAYRSMASLGLPD